MIESKRLIANSTGFLISLIFTKDYLKITVKIQEVPIWATKHLLAKIAEQNSFSQKANRLSTKKKVLKTSRKDVRLAEKQESSRETTTTETRTADGNRKESNALLF